MRLMAVCLGAQGATNSEDRGRNREVEEQHEHMKIVNQSKSGRGQFCVPDDPS